MKQVILFLRGASAYGSKELALAAINTVTHKIGQPVVATYTEGDDTKAVFVVGIKEGVGEGNYQIVASDADISKLSTLVSSLSGDLTSHKSTLAGTDAGHAKTGGDLTFTDGVATVNAGSITYSKLQSIVAESGAVLGATAAGIVTELDKAALLSLLGVEDGAQVNQNAFSNIKAGEVTVAAGAEEDTIEFVAGDNIQIVANGEAKTITISADLSDVASSMIYKGTLGTDGTIEALPDEHAVGDVYVAIAGAPSVSGKALEAGDMVICVTAGSEASDNDWTVVQTNIDGAVIGPVSSTADNIVTFDGATGKLIKDSGKKVSDLVANTVTVSAGTGLQGGGALSGNVTISHANKPSEGTDAGGTGDYVSSVTIDEFGHVVSTTKASLPTVEESGKVKVENTGTADFLEAKVITGDANDSNNTYAVQVTKEDDALKLSVKIDVIDGGVFD